eukprot:GHVR01117352.1.p1 GENE.GHVR01117352.1~~GHVR01117352.1.p1  ORF type:complete len:128 (+),score=10.28 GHVR01117352.1:645-1028(+)
MRGHYSTFRQQQPYHLAFMKDARLHDSTASAELAALLGGLKDVERHLSFLWRLIPRLPLRVFIDAAVVQSQLHSALHDPEGLSPIPDVQLTVQKQRDLKANVVWVTSGEQKADALTKLRPPWDHYSS